MEEHVFKMSIYVSIIQSRSKVDKQNQLNNRMCQFLLFSYTNVYTLTNKERLSRVEAAVFLSGFSEIQCILNEG